MGFNFRPSLPDVPIKDYIVATETYIMSAKLDAAEATLLVHEIVKEIIRMKVKQTYHPPKSNLSPNEWKAIRSLRDDDSIMIISADKGNKTIVIDKELYLTKLKARTKDHQLIAEDPSIQHEASINNKLDELMTSSSHIADKPELLLRRCELDKFKTEGAPAPWNHGLLKLHKDGFPMRDISDASQSPGHALAKTLNMLFSGYTGRSDHHLNSHSDLIGLLKSDRFKGGFFTSCDAIELYPSIIIQDALDLLEAKIKADSEWSKKTDLTKSEVISIVNLLISSPYFQCELGIFKQTKGTPMGGPLSRLFADLIMENKIEQKIKQNRKWKYIFNWVQLVDDTFMNWTESVEKLHEFHAFLNSLYPPIQSTLEIEKDGKFNIFDIAITRTDDWINTSVYRKPSASDRYLHYTSAQAWQEKAAAIHSLTLRAINYCSTPTLLSQELKYITQVFVDNGYPLEAVQRII